MVLSASSRRGHAFLPFDADLGTAYVGCQILLVRRRLDPSAAPGHWLHRSPAPVADPDHSVRGRLALRFSLHRQLSLRELDPQLLPRNPSSRSLPFLWVEWNKHQLCPEAASNLMWWHPSIGCVTLDLRCGPESLQLCQIE